MVSKLVEALRKKDSQESEDEEETDDSEQGEDKDEKDKDSSKLKIVKFSANLDPPCDAYPHQSNEKLLHRYRNFYVQMRMYNLGPTPRHEEQARRLHKNMSELVDRWRQVTRTLALRECKEFPGSQMYRKYHMIKTTGLVEIDHYISEYISNYVRSHPGAELPEGPDVRRELEYIAMVTGTDWSEENLEDKEVLVMTDMLDQYIERRSKHMDEIMEFMGGGEKAIKAAEAQYSGKPEESESDIEVTYEKVNRSSDLNEECHES